MNNYLEDNAQAYRLEFNLWAPEADYEPSDQYLLFETKDAALSCMKNPPTHMGNECLNYNVMCLMLIQYDHDEEPGYWEIKDWIAEKRNWRFDEGYA